MSFIIVFLYEVFQNGDWTEFADDACWMLKQSLYYWLGCHWKGTSTAKELMCITICEQKDMGPLPGSVWVSCPSCTPTLFWATFSDSWETGLTPPVFLVHNGSGAVRAGYRTRYLYGHLVQNHNIVGISSMFRMALIVCASYRDCCMAISLFYIQGVFWESQARLLTAAEDWSRGFHKFKSWQAALRADESSISHLIVMHSQLIKKAALGKLYSE